MKTAIVASYLILHFLFSGHFESIFAAGNINFTKFSASAGHTCTENTSFVDVSSLSKIQCSLKCSRHPSCRGVVYDPVLSKCVGCQWYTSFLPEGDTSVFYSREVYRLVTENMNWVQAKENCENLGGRLAVIKSVEEQNFIEENFLPETVNLYWIGGIENSPSDLIWLDGTSVSSGYMNWFLGEPNRGEGSYYQYCIMLYQREDFTTYTWDDAPCESQSWLIGSLCEFD